jgi:Mn-dependent DtxR family transcriptional regulator
MGKYLSLRIMMSELTFTMENYLEAIYELTANGRGARVSDIASRLGVTKASTNSAMATSPRRGSSKQKNTARST